MIKISEKLLLPSFQRVTTPCVGECVPRSHNRTERCAIQCETANEAARVRDMLIQLSLRVNDQASSSTGISPITDANIHALLASVQGPYVGMVQLICTLCLIPCPANMSRDDAAIASYPVLLAATHSVDPNQGGQPLSATEKTCLSAFLRTIASTSPVSSFFPLSVADMMAPLFGERDACPNMNAFSQASPITFGLWHVLHVRRLHSYAHPHCLGMWTELHRLSKKCSEGFDGGPMLEPIPGVQASCHGAYVETGICSGLPKIRERHPCEMDKSGEHQGSECRHGFPQGANHTGGVFTIFCKHGVCYAFFILPKAEGRDEVYSWIITHLAKAPKLIVYDFACALHAFFLNRAPAFVKFTQFCVDRIHWFNHRLCGSGYNLSLYPQHTGINSQIAEQGNSSLAQVEDAASCMNQKHFMQNLAFYLSCWNRGKLQRLQKDAAYLAGLGGNAG
jgi:hypothetical protein